MNYLSKTIVAAILGLGLSATVAAQTPAATPPKANTLDELLQQVRKARGVDQSVNQQREAKFRADRNRQKQLLQDAKSELKSEQNRAERLKNAFDGNERKLTELEETLRQRLGSLGELFGVVRQVAGDTAGTFTNSLISAQYPDRHKAMNALAQNKELPSVAQLEELWFGLQQEMTESGKIVKFPAKVVAVDGGETQRNVIRVGSFNLVSSGKFLRFLPETSQVVVLPRQPEDRYLKMAANLEAATSGFTAMALDPSRGSILSLLVQTPGYGERIEQGAEVGMAIIILGIVGLLIVVWRFIYLFAVGGKIKRQLRSDTVNPNNPLGRILTVYENNRGVDVETLELKIDEAILRDVPKLESGLSIIKIFAVIAPLMGLLGTVTGMIETFQAITLFGTGDPKLMAGGISQALVTTVLGLVTSIPLVLLHAGLSAKSKGLVSILEEQSAGIIARHAEKGAA